MDPIRLKMTAAAVGAVALATTALAVASRLNEAGAPERVVGANTDKAALVDRVAAALDAPAPVRVAAAPATPPVAIDETAAAIATATRLALAAIAEPDAGLSAVPSAAPAVAVAVAVGTPARMEVPGFRRPADAAAPAFVISASDARSAADQGWVAASGLAPATIELRPRPRDN